MTAEMFFAGESENVEFKEDIPSKSEKYLKTVVAFANGKGGRLVFGVEDATWRVTGFAKEDVFQKMDAVTNAIFDSCEPRITPNGGQKYPALSGTIRHYPEQSGSIRHYPEVFGSIRRLEFVGL